jgi:hypothetical protein
MVQKEIEELILLGKMPEATDANLDEKIVKKYEELLNKIAKPVSKEEAEVLILIFPEYSLFELEWTLLHIIESSYEKMTKKEYEELINKCSSKYWKALLINRNKP